MGSFYGQGEKPSFSAQMMSMLGIPEGMGGTNAKPGAPSTSSMFSGGGGGAAIQTTSEHDTCMSACEAAWKACTQNKGEDFDPEACRQARIACEGECPEDDDDGGGGGDGGGPRTPCEQGCYAVLKDCQQGYRDRGEREPRDQDNPEGPCKRVYNECVAAPGCGDTDPEAECDKTVCMESQLLATPRCPTPIGVHFAPCSTAPSTLCKIHDYVDPKCPDGQTWNKNAGRCEAGCKPDEEMDATGKCVKKIITGNCPGGITPGAAFGKCAPCGKKYMLVGGSCLPGYVPVPKPEGTQCECVEWCKATGYGDDCVTKTGTDTRAPLGEYAFPPEIQELYRLLMGRGKEYAERRPGYSGPAMDLMFGKGADNLRAGGVAQDASMRSILSGQGLSGTGAGNAIMGQAGMQREAGIGNLIRDLAIGNEEQTRTDRANYTNIANNLFGTGMGYNTGLEAINSSRRGEGRESLLLFLKYLESLMGSWGA